MPKIKVGKKVMHFPYTPAGEKKAKEVAKKKGVTMIGVAKWKKK